MKKGTLSVCMIVRDEENNLGRCLESIKDIADEIIIVDTGSKDSTIDIAKSYGAEVIEKGWEDDFAVARNQSIRPAQKEWILFIDADEQLPAEEGEKLKRLIQDSRYKYQGYYLKLGTMLEGEKIRESVVLRLFKNDKDYYFSGRIHEQIIDKLQKKHGMECTANTDINLLHYGHDQGEEVSRKKQKRNIDLLLKCTEAEKNCYYYYVLGNEYLRADQVDEAIRCFEYSCKMVDYNKYRYMHYPYLVINLIKMYQVKKDYQKAIEFIEEIKPGLPQFKDLYFLECLMYIDSYKFSKAKKAFREYKAFLQSEVYDYPVNYFEKSYDIDRINEILQEYSINQKDNLLDAIMICTTEEAVNTLLNVNEICTQVVTIVPEEVYDEAVIKGLGAKIVKYVEKDMLVQLEKAQRKCKSKYILMIKQGKVLTHEERRMLIEQVTREQGAKYSLFDELPTGERIIFGMLLLNEACNVVDSFDEIYK